MSDTLKPRDVKEVEDAVRWALGNDKALEVAGSGSKRAIVGVRLQRAAFADGSRF